MNSEKFATFAEAYRKGLSQAVEKDLQRRAEERHYTYRIEEVPQVVEKMLRTIEAKPLGVNYDSDGFRCTCKLLGIKPTRKAIFAFLEITI